jgi:membrane protease YdiL (CAAX protease family)
MSPFISHPRIIRAAGQGDTPARGSFVPLPKAGAESSVPLGDNDVMLDRLSRKPTWWDAVLAAASAAMGIFILNVLALPLFHLASAWDLSAVTRIGLSALVAETGLALALVFVVTTRKLELQSTFALRPAPGRALAAALLAIAGGGALLDELMFQMVRLWPALNTGALEQVGRTLASAGPAGALALVVPLGLAPALCEEFLCRGVIFRGLLQGGRSPWAALVVSSAFFGALHVDRLHALAAGLMGLLLGFIAWRTGSIWVPVVCHLFNNLISLFVPVFGGPNLADVLEQGHSTWANALALASLVIGLTLLVKTTVSTQHESGDGSPHEQQGDAARTEHDQHEGAQAGATHMTGHDEPKE